MWIKNLQIGPVSTETTIMKLSKDYDTDFMEEGTQSTSRGAAWSRFPFRIGPMVIVRLMSERGQERRFRGAGSMSVIPLRVQPVDATLLRRRLCGVALDQFAL